MTEIEIFSRYWADPLANLVIVLSSILLLYPLAWHLTTKQLGAAVKAIETARQLPETISQLNDASHRLSEVNRELVNLKEQLSTLETINDRLTTTTRQLSDLQKLTEEQASPPVADTTTTAPTSEAENWEVVAGIWQVIKSYLELKIEQIPDGRVRRKYNQVTRHTYEQIADYLKYDNLVSEEQFHSILELDRTFRSIRNRRTPVTSEIRLQFEVLKEKIIQQ